MSADESREDRTHSYFALTNGTEVSHYRIVEKIGAGGMGEVYLALDTKLNRKVALKFLPPHLCQDEDCRKRFTREAQAAASLDHPNIAAIHEVGEFQGRPFYAMQIVEGQSLKDVMAGRVLPIHRILEIGIQICEGLKAAHDKGIIHRDIKPSNILVDGHGRVRVVDFGLAVIRGSEHLTKTGSTLGTVGYMSPEQIEGNETDARSDLFSLGVVLYELIANKSPFRRDDETATLKAILHDEPEPLARYKSNVPDDLQRIVSKLLEKDPTLRYQSAAGVIPDLKKLSSRSTASMVIERRRDRWNRYVVPSAMVVVLAVLATWYFGFLDRVPTPSGEDDRIMLAVLPFENLGDPDDEYFADGITYEITSRLATIHGWGVISRTSAMQYKGVSKSLPDIGRELGADYILDGTIRWEKGEDVNKVRITPQLIAVSEDKHIWANNYERSLTGVFEIQIDIATQIANALNVTLLGSEESILAEWPTSNLEAYDYYLRGRDHADEVDQLPRAEEMFEKAIEIDSSFALAYAHLSQVVSLAYWRTPEQFPEKIELARTHAKKALELAPELAEAHLALGYYHYFAGRDYDQALEEFEIGLRGQPNNSDLLAAIGAMKRRQGQWQEGYELLKRSVMLDPSNRINFMSFVDVCTALRKYREALAACDRCLDSEPNVPEVWASRVVITGLFLGDTAAARVIRAEADAVIGKSDVSLWFWWFDITVGDFEAALEVEPRRIDKITSTADSGEYYYHYAATYHAFDKTEKSRAYFDSARACLEQVMSSDSVIGHYPEAKMMLAKSYAGLGRNDDAIVLAQSTVEAIPRTKDAVTGIALLEDLGEVYVMTGDYEAAIDILDTLFSVPSYINTTLVQLYPLFNPLRDHPRFQALIEKYENEHGI